MRYWDQQFFEEPRHTNRTALTSPALKPLCALPEEPSPLVEAGYEFFTVVSMSASLLPFTYHPNPLRPIPREVKLWSGWPCWQLHAFTPRLSFQALNSNAAFSRQRAIRPCCCPPATRVIEASVEALRVHASEQAICCCPLRCLGWG